MPRTRKQDATHPRQKSKALTRERLYTKAMRLFETLGYENVNIDDIVRDAETSRGTFYFHYPTKDDVLLDAVRRGETLIVQRLRELPANTEVEKILETTANAFVEAWGHRRALLPYAGTVSLRRIAGVSAERDTDPLRFELAQRIAALEGRSRTFHSILPAQMLADLFLVNVFAGLMAWGSNSEYDIDTVMPAIIMLYLRGVLGFGEG